jgi:hypothetical protein
MTGLELVWKTLDYGRNTTTNASWLTLFTIMFAISLLFMLFKLQWVILSPGKSPATNASVKRATARADRRGRGRSDYNKFIKALPAVTAIIILAVFIRWLIKLNISYKRMTWQSDYFVAFMVVLFLFILMMFYQTKLQLRRSVSWMVLNQMFKLTMVIFGALIFAPYYVLSVAQQESFWDGGYWTYGFLIFLTYTIMCFYAFRMSPLSTLIPMVVLWGAAISYYTTSYALRYAILGNGSGIIVMIFSLAGVSIFKGIARHQRVASPEFLLAYCIFIFIIIGGMWFALWEYYEYPFFGTDHEAFHESSFYTTKK